MFADIEVGVMISEAARNGQEERDGKSVRYYDGNQYDRSR